MEHAREYRDHLAGEGKAESHVAVTVGYLDRDATALGWSTLGDLDAPALAHHLGRSMAASGRSPRWFNAHAKAWRAFARWCVRNGRLASDPLAGLAMRRQDTDRRRVRRALDADELAALIGWADTHPVVSLPRAHKDSDGKRQLSRVNYSAPYRALAYRIASMTGFRASEVASLTPESFELSGETPSITVKAAYSKRRREDRQPIRQDVAAALRPFLVNLEPGKPVCPLPDGKAGLMVRADLEAARAAWIESARSVAEREARERSGYLRWRDDAGRVADFHCLRHTYISAIVAGGASAKVAQELARHSTPTLTLGVYAHARLADMTAALPRLPTPTSTDTESGVVRATGTYGRDATPDDCQRPRQCAGHELVPKGATGRGESSGARQYGEDAKALQFPVTCDVAQLSADPRGNRGGRIRTADLLTPSQTR